MKRIGEVISSHRRDRRLSQSELSHRLAGKEVFVSNAAISAWEKGSSMPSAQALLGVCEVLDIYDIYTPRVPKEGLQYLPEKFQKEGVLDPESNIQFGCHSHCPEADEGCPDPCICRYRHLSG